MDRFFLFHYYNHYYY